MATEIAEGGQAALDAFARMRDSSVPAADRYDADFTDHDPAAGQPAGRGGMAWFWEQFGTSFSDIERDVIETIASDGKASDRWGSTDELGILQQLGLAP